jgi:MoxR-like ATPase
VLDARPAVTAEHIRQAAPLVLRHRVLPNYNAAGEGVTADQIVARVLYETTEPMYAT